MYRTLLTLALIAAAGASYAQTVPTNEPRDPYGRPLIGRNDYVRQPGDQAGPGGPRYGSNVATAPSTSGPSTLSRDHATGPEPMPPEMRAGPRQTAFKDEYGFRYDAQGNRLDARGNIISPHLPQQR